MHCTFVLWIFLIPYPSVTIPYAETVISGSAGAFIISIIIIMDCLAFLTEWINYWWLYIENLSGRWWLEPLTVVVQTESFKQWHGNWRDPRGGRLQHGILKPGSHFHHRVESTCSLLWLIARQRKRTPLLGNYSTYPASIQASAKSQGSPIPWTINLQGAWNCKSDYWQGVKEVRFRNSVAT